MTWGSVLWAFVTLASASHARRMHIATDARRAGPDKEAMGFIGQRYGLSHAPKTSSRPELDLFKILALQFIARRPSAEGVATAQRSGSRNHGLPHSEPVLARRGVHTDSVNGIHAGSVGETPSLGHAAREEVLTEGDCKGLLDLVCSSSDRDLRSMGFEPLTAGFANHVWSIKTKGHHLVIKCYTDLAFLRLDPEAMGSVDTIVGQAGIGPYVRYSSRQGLVMDRVDGHTLEEKDVHKDDLALLERLAKAVSRLHRLPVPEACKGPPMLWRSIDRTVSVASDKLELWPLDMPSIDVVKKEIRWAKDALKRISPKIVLSHGDLKPSNVISDKNRSEVHIIDCELGGPNYRAFDLMKIFRTAKERSHNSMRHFFHKYSEEVDGSASERSVDMLVTEAEMFEPLTWLEASCFFLAMPQFKPEETSTWHRLAVDRWNKYQETKHMLDDSSGGQESESGSF